MKPLNAALHALQPLFDAYPTAKFRNLMPHATAVENGPRQSAHLLNMTRSYFLKVSGEESPFVKKIDQLLDRPQPTTNTEP